jgi:hypothetical protein
MQYKLYQNAANMASPRYLPPWQGGYFDQLSDECEKRLKNTTAALNRTGYNALKLCMM